jgi:ABC-type transporter Mla subunit MlaD
MKSEDQNKDHQSTLPIKARHMQNHTNPLIGSSRRETINNATEALSAVVVLLANNHGGLSELLSPVLAGLEGDADAIERAAQALSQAVVLLADRDSDLCRLLMPVLHAVEHASSQADDPIAAYNLRAEMVRAVELA